MKIKKCITTLDSRAGPNILRGPPSIIFALHFMHLFINIDSNIAKYLQKNNYQAYNNS